jgi:hypothetical protein
MRLQVSVLEIFVLAKVLSSDENFAEQGRYQQFIPLPFGISGNSAIRPNPRDNSF